MDFENVRRIWRGYKSWIQIGVFIGAVVAAIVIPFIQAPLCSVAHKGDEPATYRVTIDRPYSPQQSAEREYRPLTQISLGPSVNSGVGEIEHTESSYYAAKQEENWGRAFWCDVKASDYFLVMFTLWLAVSTFFLWRETERLAAGAIQQSSDMAKSIREQRRTAAANIVAARAARKAADAADRHAKIAVGAESPLLHVTSCNSFYASSEDLDSWLRKFAASIKIKNFGRTSAIVTELLVNLRIGLVPSQPPDLVTYNHYPTAVAVEGGQTEEFVDIWLAKGLTEDDIQKWMADTENRSMYIFGVIRYQDFTGLHEQGFLFLGVHGKSFCSFEQKTAYYKKT